MVMDQLKEIEVTAQTAQSSLADEFAAKYKEGYDVGYTDGKASVVLPDPANPDKIFTQADLDRAVSVAKDEVATDDKDALAKSAADLAASQAQLAAVQADVDGKAAAAFAVLKSNLKSEYDRLQVVETEAETGFGALLV